VGVGAAGSGLASPCASCTGGAGGGAGTAGVALAEAAAGAADAIAGAGGGGGGGGGRLSLPPPQATVSASGKIDERAASFFRGFIGPERIVPQRLERKTLSLTSPQARASFAFPPTMPFRSRYLFVCTNRRPDGHAKGSCAEKGSEELAQRLKEALARRGIAKTLVRSCSASCLDLCELGIAVLQEPDHVAYGRVTLDDVDAIADAAEHGEIVSRLVVFGPGGGAS
jgi:(2Fe-2S) ferredoxin